MFLEIQTIQTQAIDKADEEKIIINKNHIIYINTDSKNFYQIHMSDGSKFNITEKEYQKLSNSDLEFDNKMTPKQFNKTIRKITEKKN